ncbi:hypothetical protein [Kamptonema formosum]|nr:hypothetical protein [Oscillatoria sp. PCC 10802]
MAVPKGQEQKCWPVGERIGDRLGLDRRLPRFWPTVRRTAGLAVLFEIVP